MRKGSKIAMYIERDMKIQQAYEKRQREKCTEKTCDKCQYENICENKEGKYEDCN